MMESEPSSPSYPPFYPLGSQRKRYCPGCSVPIAIYAVSFLGLMIGLTIATFYFNLISSSDELCIVDLPQLGYRTWLAVYAYTNTFVTLILVQIAYRYYCDTGLHEYFALDNRYCYRLYILSIIIDYSFQVVWYIIGQMIFFNRNEDHCSYGQPLHDFWVSIMFLQIAVFLMASLGLKILRQYHQRRQDARVSLPFSI